MAGAPSDEELVTAVRKVLADADSDTITPKGVRKAVEAALGVSLKERKAFLKSTIISILQEGASDSNSEAEDDEPPASPAPKKKKKKDGYMKLLAVSEQLAPLMGVSEIKRSDATKKLWQILKSEERGLQKNNKGAYVLDEELASVFKRKTLNFKTISKALSQHLFDTKFSEHGRGWADDEDEEAAKRKTAADKKKKRKREASKKKPARATKTKKARTGSNGKSGFQKPVKLSADMASFVGAESMSRPQVVKRLWEHIKANELQKPSDKRTIINDAVLKKLAGVDEMTMFSMNKLLKHHFIKE